MCWFNHFIFFLLYSLYRLQPCQLCQCKLWHSRFPLNFVTYINVCGDWKFRLEDYLFIWTEELVKNPMMIDNPRSYSTSCKCMGWSAYVINCIVRLDSIIILFFKPRNTRHYWSYMICVFVKQFLVFGVTAVGAGFWWW